MSLLRSTGRIRRLYAWVLVVILGGAAMFFGEGVVAIFGFTVLFASLFLGWFTVTCPQCQTKWLLHFMRTSNSSQWLMDLLSMESCPSCGFRNET